MTSSCNFVTHGLAFLAHFALESHEILVMCFSNFSKTVLNDRSDKAGSDNVWNEDHTHHQCRTHDGAGHACHMHSEQQSPASRFLLPLVLDIGFSQFKATLTDLGGKSALHLCKSISVHHKCRWVGKEMCKQFKLTGKFNYLSLN